MPTKLELRDAILCEDVRQEVTGKHIIIGAFSGGIIVPAFPANITINFYMPFIALEAGNIPFVVRFSIEDGPTAILEGALDIASIDDAGALFGPRMDFPMQKAGYISIEFSDDGGENWVTIGKKSVAEGAVNSPIGVV